MHDNLWKVKRKWNFRIGNLEVGSCDNKLMYEGVQNQAEICQWAVDNSSRWTIAIFEPASCGFDLRMLGDRTLDKTVDWRDFKRIYKIGLKLLKEYRE